jgi:RecB family endonuclease NucS
MVNIDELCQLIATRNEWLLVRDEGRTFPLLAGEIDVSSENERARFGFLDDKGLHTWRLNGFALQGTEISIDVAGAFARRRETMRLVPRVTAAELSAEVETARLQQANEIARMIADSFPGVKLGRVSLNKENGRLAQIQFQTSDKRPCAAVCDITASLTAETVFTTAMLWLEKLGMRKNKPVNEIWVVGEQRQSANARKLHALLSDRWKKKMTIVEIDRRQDPPAVRQLPKRKLTDLWREKSVGLKLPQERRPSDMARRMIDLAPGCIDVVFSRQGETLRFMGLPFARVRAVAGTEKGWFGIGRERRILDDGAWDELTTLVDELRLSRSPDAPNKRHEYYRSAPEAWLESILRRNIKLLDANLILSPLYNQFRSSNDKIDLLALRRDGRLVIVELKTQPDREMVFQAADYWRKIELQRRKGIMAAADLFDGRDIMDKPALVYLAAPAWSFHRDFDLFARCISPEIELWRFELHENWRSCVKVLARRDYAEGSSGLVNR